MKKIPFLSQDQVSETLLIPLFFRAKESQRSDALLKDEHAEELVQRIDYDWSRIKLQTHDEVALILRVQEFDRQVCAFLARHPDAVVVHIGCGLDTRFERVDNGQVEWFDLDLPEVIAMRRQLLGESLPRCRQLAGSVFDTAWMDTVSALGDRPLLLAAEGVLMYFTETQVKDLVLAVMQRFPGAELVCDAATSLIIFLDNLHLVVSRMRARLRWGLPHPCDLENWATGIRLLDEWYYYDRPEPRLEPYRWMRHIPWLGRGTGIFHYRLGEKTTTMIATP